MGISNYLLLLCSCLCWESLAKAAGSLYVSENVLIMPNRIKSYMTSAQTADITASPTIQQFKLNTYAS